MGEAIGAGDGDESNFAVALVGPVFELEQLSDLAGSVRGASIIIPCSSS